MAAYPEVLDLDNTIAVLEHTVSQGIDLEAVEVTSPGDKRAKRNFRFAALMSSDELPVPNAEQKSLQSAEVSQESTASVEDKPPATIYATTSTGEAVLERLDVEKQVHFLKQENATLKARLAALEQDKKKHTTKVNTLEAEVAALSDIARAQNQELMLYKEYCEERARGSYDTLAFRTKPIIAKARLMTIDEARRMEQQRQVLTREESKIIRKAKGGQALKDIGKDFVGLAVDRGKDLVEKLSSTSDRERGPDRLESSVSSDSVVPQPLLEPPPSPAPELSERKKHQLELLRSISTIVPDPSSEPDLALLTSLPELPSTIGSVCVRCETQVAKYSCKVCAKEICRNCGKKVLAVRFGPEAVHLCLDCLPKIAPEFGGKKSDRRSGAKRK